MKTVLPLVSLVLLTACGAAPAGVTEITPEELLSSPPTSALILDVRTADEFASGHVPGALNISHEALAGRISELRADKSRPVVVYCEKGGRAGKAASVLLDAGFSDVRHLAGDMNAWRAADRPME